MAVAFALLVLGCVGSPPATNDTCSLKTVEMRSGATLDQCEKLWTMTKDKLGISSQSGKPGFIAGHMCLPLASLIDKNPPKPQAAPVPESTEPEHKIHV